MNCFAEKLRLNVCEVSDAQFPVNSLAGVDASMFHQLQKSDEPDILDLFNDINSAAWLLFKSTFIQSFLSKYSMVKASDSFGALLRPVTVVPAYAGTAGIVIDASGKSNYQYITVKSLFVYAQSPQTFDVEFWDLEMSVLLYTQTVTVATGKNRIAVNQSFDSNMLFVCYDASVSILYDTDYYGADGSCQFCKCCNDGLSVYGGKSTATPVYPVTQNGRFSGLGLDIDFGCNIEDLICENVNDLLNGYIYAFGASMKQEQTQTKKANAFTTFKPEEPEKSYNHYHERMVKEIDSFVESMRLPDGFCAKCKQLTTNTFSV